MLKFNHEKSVLLDEEIISTLSDLLQNQKQVRQKTEKQEFLLQERKVIYDLFMRVNQERRLLRDEYLLLLQKLAKKESCTSVECTIEDYERKKKEDEELYQKCMEKEKEKNQRLLLIISSQKKEISELWEKLSFQHSLNYNPEAQPQTLSEVLPVPSQYCEANITELIAHKKENEKLEEALPLIDNVLEDCKEHSFGSASPEFFPQQEAISPPIEQSQSVFEIPSVQK